MPLKVTLLGAVCALTLTGTAQAKGWYIGLEAGASSIADTDADFGSTTGGLTTFAYSPRRPLRRRLGGRRDAGLRAARLAHRRGTRLAQQR